jgi:2-polyprenyl-3-methyl-5-hydroxy-6-metoxy-1,4-benzoquinol methylase
MSNWHRQVPFGADHGHEWDECWHYRSLGNVHSFNVRVRAGKPLGVLGLKGIDLDNVRKYSDFLAGTAKRLYGPDDNTSRVRQCPMCGHSLDGAAVELSVFGVSYLRCNECGHVCVGLRPRATVLEKVFAESEAHSSVYTDPRLIEIRMEQIIAPKLDWCVRQFVEQHGHGPRSVLDVGAGGGHFLAGAIRRGLSVEGFEKSRVSRAFARETFDLSLREDDFIAADAAQVDMVTFWGLLEYVPNPREFIAAARRWIGPNGMLVVEVPRVDSLGTFVQGMERAVVARHMDPTTHLNGFTDASLCTALVEEAFAPVAAWYFGMDAYEACVQAALRFEDSTLLDALTDFIPVIQQALDRGRQCDDIVISAVPVT